MQKMLKEVLLSPMCQVLQVAFDNLRLSWVQPQIKSDHAGQVYWITQLNYHNFLLSLKQSPHCFSPLITGTR